MKKTGYIFTMILGVLLVLLSAHTPIFGQQDQASLLLDLKKARATYDIAKQKLENDRKLFENKAISESEFNNSNNELLQAEVEYQKLILKVLAQSSYIIVERAIKYQNERGERRVTVTIRSTMEGNQEYLNQFEDYFDVVSPEMRTNKIYNVFVSLINLNDQTIIGSPYEERINALELGQSATVDFGLLRDVESLQVSLNYEGRKDFKNIYLEKDASANLVDIMSTQFSQEADLGNNATFDLTLERFSSVDDVYQLTVLNLPRQVSYEFFDSETNARLSQIRFTQGVNTKRLSLRVFLPERDDEEVTIDKPIEFVALVLTSEEFDNIAPLRNQFIDENRIDAVNGGKVRLELIPRGVGIIEVRAPSLYHEITVGERVEMDITVKNIGTRRLDNIKVSTDNPFNWTTTIAPDLIRSLEPEDEESVRLTFEPPSDVGIGSQEIRVRTEAMANNRSVESDDKTVRIQVQSQTPVFWTTLLILVLVGMIIGIVLFGIKITRR
ncbi:NEW3 domain-containing protein [candidate division KSB1 bacterium]